jgi:hypothetical protein
MKTSIYLYSKELGDFVKIGGSGHCKNVTEKMSTKCKTVRANTK